MWAVCPNCTSTQDPNAKSVWSDLTGNRMGLEIYIALCDAGFPPQELLGILRCPEHYTAPAPKPLDDEARRQEMAQFFQGHRSTPGGIVESDTRRV